MDASGPASRTRTTWRSESPPTIEGFGNLNENEAADIGIWSGLPSAYAYQWERCDGAGTNCTDIDGAISPSYVPTPDDYGATVRVRVVATNGIGSSAPVESAASGVLGLASAPPAISTAPDVSGSATVGEQLSTTNGTWLNSATSYAYQWQRCDATGSNCVDVAGATSSQYTVVGDDAGSTIRSEVLASNGIGPALTGYALSATTNAVIWVGTPAIPTAPADQATAFQLDPAHDGSIANAGLAAPLTEAWSVTLPVSTDCRWHGVRHGGQRDGVCAEPGHGQHDLVPSDRHSGLVAGAFVRPRPSPRGG